MDSLLHAVAKDNIEYVKSIVVLHTVEELKCAVFLSKSVEMAKYLAELCNTDYVALLSYTSSIDIAKWLISIKTTPDKAIIYNQNIDVISYLLEETKCTYEELFNTTESIEIVNWLRHDKYTCTEKKYNDKISHIQFNIKMRSQNITNNAVQLIESVLMGIDKKLVWKQIDNVANALLLFHYGFSYKSALESDNEQVLKYALYKLGETYDTDAYVKLINDYRSYTYNYAVMDKILLPSFNNISKINTNTAVVRHYLTRHQKEIIIALYNTDSLEIVEILLPFINLNTLNNPLNDIVLLNTNYNIQEYVMKYLISKYTTDTLLTIQQKTSSIDVLKFTLSYYSDNVYGILRNGNVEIIDYITTHYPLTIKEYNDALLYHINCLYSDDAIIQLLINKGANNLNEVIKDTIPNKGAYLEFSPKLNIVLLHTNPKDLLSEKIQVYMLNTGYGVLLNMNKKLLAYEEAGPYLRHRALVLSKMPFIPEISTLVTDYLAYEC
jgi:hypothetical protein